jgi:hypothetical protein
MMWRKVVLIGLMVSILSRVSVAEAKDTHYWGDAGWGVLAVLANIPYVPAKLLYAGVGTLTGGLAYLLTVGDTDTAQKVWSPSVGGSYVITPAMLHGDEPVLFNGPSYSND